MIFANEVNAILDDELPAEQVKVLVEHAQGGFHPNVLPDARSAFTQWMQGLEDEPMPQHPQVEQLDLLEPS